MYLVLLVYDMMHLDQLFTVFQKKKVKCIKIDGQTPVTTRQTLVTDFQNKDGIRVAVVRCYPSYMFSIQF
jgi:SNF2 family DNA or RNA helicase